MFDLAQWLDTTGYMPHGHCYLWQPHLLVLHAGSDSLIALAYFSIPLLLFHVVRRRGDESYSFLARMFAAFIVLCGATHLMAVYTIWEPAYLPDGLIKAATAIVSVATAVVLWRMTPTLIALPSPGALETANRHLLEEIAERRQAERQRDAERVRSLRILEATSDAIIATDRDGIVLFANRSSGGLLGHASDSLVGRPIVEILELRRPDGTGSGGGAAELLARSLAGEPSEHRHMLVSCAGGEQRHVLASATAMDDGDDVGVVFSLADITAAQTAHAALARAERMDALGRFAGGLAHDFNNLLTAISGNIELVSRRVADRPELARRLEQVLAAARRGSALTRRLLMMSRHHGAMPRTLDLAPLMDELEVLLDSTVGEAVVLTIRVAEDLPPVTVDPAELEAALINLAINARDAMPDGGTLTVTAATRELGADAPGELARLEPGRYLEIAVADTGTGIADEVRRRMFEPFYTTKDGSHGSGLGLSMVHGFVSRCGGGIAVETAPGAGTTFRLLLPAAVDRGREQGSAGTVAAAPDGERTVVLVVEDQELVRELTVGMVEELGYAALSAADGAAALAVLARHPEIGLLLTDVIMPGGIDGAELAARTRRARPDLPIVLCTGYASDRLESGGPTAGMPVLRKPFGLDELALALRTALRAPAA